jgi:hypothetical protein
LSLNGIKVVEKINSNYNSSWFQIEGYSDELNKSKDEIVDLIHEIDPLGIFADNMTSPYIKLLIVLSIPLATTVVKNYAKKNNNNNDNNDNDNDNIKKNDSIKSIRKNTIKTGTTFNFKKNNMSMFKKK